MTIERKDESKGAGVVCAEKISIRVCGSRARRFTSLKRLSGPALAPCRLTNEIVEHGAPA